MCAMLGLSWPWTLLLCGCQQLIMAGGGGVRGGFQFHYSTVDTDTDKIGLCSRTPSGVHGGWGSRREGLLPQPRKGHQGAAT